MGVLTQGTHIFFIDPEGSSPSVIRVERATTLSPGGSPADQIDDTALEDFDKVFAAGLRTPGQATMGVNADPNLSSHIRLHELSQANPQPTLKWAVGWSDGTDVPTVASDGGFNLPTTRTWLEFDGYVSDFPFDFAGNTIVTTQATIQRSGGLVWTKKS